MLPVEDKKTMFILDCSIVCNSSACFNIIHDYSQLGNIFINYDFISNSQNYKLKRLIIANGVKTSDDMIEIENTFGTNIANTTETAANTESQVNENAKYKIIVQKHKNSRQINDAEKLFETYKILSLEYDPIIFTLSMDVKLECKLRDIQCELYSNNSDGKIGIYSGQVAPKLNQFKYDENNKTLERFVDDKWKFVNNTEIYGFNPLSYKQKGYLDLLLDDNISLVLCSGSAGTGKTFLACLTGVFKMLEHEKYTNIVLSRATIDIGDNSIGFLPGSKEEKMSHWVQPMKDNLDIILKKVKETNKNKKTNLKTESKDDDSNDSCDVETFEYSTMLTLSKKQRKKQQKKFRKTTRFSYVDTSKKQEEDEWKVESFIKDEKIKIECISFFRGRTFVDTFCIIDEAQNLTTHEIKTIITRIGKGSKLIMIGDTEQCDLKKQNNDFSNTIKQMAGHAIVGVIALDATVRGGLCDLAIKLL